jgi:hypothetical protein
MQKADASSWHYRTIAQTEVSSIWDLVKPGLERVRCKAKAEWRTEDIYASLVSGTSTLRMGYMGEVFAGATVTYTREQPFSHEKHLFIWALFAEAFAPVGLVVAELETIARTLGCVQIVFYSPRRRWLRRLESSGFELAQYEIRKKVC